MKTSCKVTEARRGVVIIDVAADATYKVRAQGSSAKRAKRLGRWKRPDTAIRHAKAWLEKQGAK